MRSAQDILQNILDPAGADKRDKEFPNAPTDWNRARCEQSASEMQLTLSDDHWETVRVLQACFAEEEYPPTRRLADALDATFHAKGGRKYLFRIFPGGPVAQGCALAGVDAPSGSVDNSFGSVR